MELGAMVTRINSAASFLKSTQLGLIPVNKNLIRGIISTLRIVAERLEEMTEES
jgi:hypothetical protein